MADYINPKRPPKGSRPAPRPPKAPTLVAPKQRAPAPAPLRNQGFNMPGAPAVTYPNTPPPQPYYAPAPAPAPYSVPQNNFFAQPGGGNGSGGMQGTIPGPSQMAPMPAPAAPPPDTRRRVSRGASNGEIGQIDSTFADQESMFLEALQKFMAENQEEEKGLRRDTDVAEEGIGRNRKLGLTGLAEDFAARGLTNSGLFAKSRQESDTAYDRQLSGVVNAEADGVRRLTSGRRKYESENKAQVQAAKRDALARLAMDQNLVVTD